MQARLVFFPVQYFNRRLLRCFRHIIYPFYKSGNHLPPNSIMDWIIDGLCYLLELLLVPEVFVLANFILKHKMRHLTNYEKMLAKNVFGSTICIDKIVIDDKASFLTKSHNFAYVSFNLINYWGNMRDEVLIHELMHVYQFQKYGLVYIYRAIKAQRSKEGYDYGGINGLQSALASGKQLFDFNFEQQASIIEHYFQISQSSDLRNDDKMLTLYKSFYQQIF